jgi:hypothetical protein
MVSQTEDTPSALCDSGRRFAVEALEEPARPFLTLDGTFTVLIVARSRQEDHIPFTLVWALLIMGVER